MIKYEDTIGFDELTPEIVKQIIKMGLEEKIKIYGTMIRYDKIQFTPLYISHIELIRSNHPEKTTVIFDDSRSDKIYNIGVYDKKLLLSQGKAIRASVDDLRGSFEF